MSVTGIGPKQDKIFIFVNSLFVKMAPITIGIKGLNSYYNSCMRGTSKLETKFKCKILPMSIGIPQRFKFSLRLPSARHGEVG